jgi:hypothetical protein
MHVVLLFLLALCLVATAAAHTDHGFRDMCAYLARGRVEVKTLYGVYCRESMPPECTQTHTKENCCGNH